MPLTTTEDALEVIRFGSGSMNLPFFYDNDDVIDGDVSGARAGAVIESELGAVIGQLATKIFWT